MEATPLTRWKYLVVPIDVRKVPRPVAVDDINLRYHLDINVNINSLEILHNHWGNNTHLHVRLKIQESL